MQIKSSITFPAPDFSGELVLQTHHARQEQYPKASERVIQFCTYNWYSSTRTLDGRLCTKEKMVDDQGQTVPAFMGFTIYFIMRLAFADVIPRST